MITLTDGESHIWFDIVMAAIRAGASAAVAVERADDVILALRQRR